MEKKEQRLKTCKEVVVHNEFEETTHRGPRLLFASAHREKGKIIWGRTVISPCGRVSLPFGQLSCVAANNLSQQRPMDAWIHDKTTVAWCCVIWFDYVTCPLASQYHQNTGAGWGSQSLLQIEKKKGCNCRSPTMFTILINLVISIWNTPETMTWSILEYCFSPLKFSWFNLGVTKMVLSWRGHFREPRGWPWGEHTSQREWQNNKTCKKKKKRKKQSASVFEPLRKSPTWYVNV